MRDRRDYKDLLALKGRKAIKGLTDPRDRKVALALRGQRATSDRKDHKGTQG